MSALIVLVVICLTSNFGLRKKDSHLTMFFQTDFQSGKTPGVGVLRDTYSSKLVFLLPQHDGATCMKKLMMSALCACLLSLVAGIASAQYRLPSQPQRMVPEPAPVAGYSPNFAAPQPITGKPLATLTTDANRLIRWQGWLDVDAFSTSILNQMKKQLDDGLIEAGTFTITEPAIAAAVKKASCSPTFVMNENLCEGMGESFQGDIKLYVWLYRHNFADTGLHQLYISAKGKMLIGRDLGTVPSPHRDIQSLGYEFGPNGVNSFQCGVYADIEIWRGAVVRVDATGAMVVVGNEAGAVTPCGVEEAPMSEWERAPSLENNPHYNPKRATGAAFVEPLDRKIRINANDVQVTTGSVQKEGRVNTVPVFRYRAR